MRIKPASRWGSLAIWCMVSLFVMGTFLPTLLVDSNNRMDPDRETFAVLVKNWRVHLGPELHQADEWLTLDEARSALQGYEGTVWLQRPLPELFWEHPYLFFSHMHRFQVFLDGELLYQFNMDNTHRYYHHQYVLHPVLISQEDEGKTLLIKTEWEGQALFGHDMAIVGEADQLLYVSILTEISWLVYALLAIVSGIVGFIMFVRGRVALYGWFALLFLSTGMYLLFSCKSLQWFIDMLPMYYWKELIMPIMIWGGVGFYFTGLHVNPRLATRIGHYSMAIYTLLTVAVAASFPHFFLRYSQLGITIVFVIGFAFVSYMMIRDAMKRRRSSLERGEAGAREERKWLVRGYWTLLFCAIAGNAPYLAPVMLTEWLVTLPYLFRVIEGAAPNGILLFIICMIMVLIARVRGMHLESERNAGELLVKNKELEHFHRNLEQLVTTRTVELERANRTLALTLREKAETLAEMSVLEERNRIAYEMHDVVGHTLTAAIVQLEATKRLTEREDRLPLEKLDLLSELVRKGLDDIRKTVRLMKSDEARPLSLEASLLELIQYTEDTMEIEVDYEIAVPAGLALGKMTESVIYHALQEGLTNGIRHGGSRRFRFTLLYSAAELSFRLVSGGEPFGSAVHGFGLTSMMERVELLGGKVSIGSSALEDGTPNGCELRISLPI